MVRVMLVVALVTLIVTVVLGFIAALQPKEVKDCILRAAAMLIILIAHLMIVIIAKPYSALIDTIFWTLGYILQIVAISVVIDAQLSKGGDIEAVNKAYDSAGGILSGFAAIFMIYGLISLCYLVAEVLQKCEDPRDPASRRKRNLNSNIQQFAEELKRMELTGESGAAGGDVALRPPNASSEESDNSDDDQERVNRYLDDDESDPDEDPESPAARRKRARRAREREERKRNNLSSAIRLSVTATPGDKKAGIPTRYGFQRAFEPAVLALDGGNFDAKDRDRRMAQEQRNAETDYRAKQQEEQGGGSLYSPLYSSRNNNNDDVDYSADVNVPPPMQNRASSYEAPKTAQEIMDAWGISADETSHL